MSNGIQEFVCNVNQAGVADNPGGYPNPQVLLMLTDVGGSFDHAWVPVASSCRREALAVALAAISNGMTVNAWLVPPNSGAAICYNIYIIGS